MSRNKREGYYHGKYAAPYKVKHWRGKYSGCMREYAKFKKINGF